MTARQALAFVERSGIALESGRGPVPSLAETIAGAPLRGSWWGHPKSKIIFRCSRALRDSADVLTCRLVGGKVTYVHRRLWPALVRLADRFPTRRLAAIRETHTASGSHKISLTKFPAWVPAEVATAAADLSVAQAVDVLRIILPPHR